MGWDKILENVALTLERGEQPAQPYNKPLMLNSGTANFKMMDAYDWLLWSYLFGKPQDEAAATARCLELLASQARDGFMCVSGQCEQTAGDPHMNYHLFPVAGMRIAARRFGIPKLMTATAGWFRNYRAIYRLVRVNNQRGMQPLHLIPGMRCKGAPISQNAADLSLRVIENLRMNRLGEKPSTWVPAKEWPDLFHGARHCRTLKRDGDDFGGEPAPGFAYKLYLPMNVQRDEQHLVVSLEKPAEPEHLVFPCDWVKGDVQQSALLEFGMNWASPVPPLE